MAELHIWTAWQWTCPECGKRYRVTSSRTRRNGAVLSQRIWDHLQDVHRIVGGVRTAKVVGAGTHIVLQPADGWQWNEAERLAIVLEGDGVLTDG